MPVEMIPIRRFRGILGAVAMVAAALLAAALAQAGTLDCGPPGQPGISDFAGVTLNGTEQLTSLSIDPISRWSTPPGRARGGTCCSPCPIWSTVARRSRVEHDEWPRRGCSGQRREHDRRDGPRDPGELGDRGEDRHRFDG